MAVGKGLSRNKTKHLDSARPWTIEAKRSKRGNSSPSGKSDEEDRLGEVAASPNASDYCLTGPKRIFDVVFSLLVLIIAAPFFLVCMLIVKLSSRGPIFYAHPRIGYQGKPFGCFKFRTMYRDADTKLKPLLASDPALMNEWKTYFKLKIDPRITPIGKFLRKTSLDELPQFWNVLKGEMSVVGPRPMTSHEVTHYVKDKARTILSVRPGLTTIWITQGRNDLSLEERISSEEYYVIHRTFWLDCKLIGKTIVHLIFPKGAY